ncbi:hypothetical protein [Treponema brennaborense]|uniref:Uncharacterized protein n=1 Tax=Treponema brennaborense (strain DSM 12168 / CIP 105900 / DD5/3) TaxID=906968 RepID=F4LNI4_TREBD|nr:hypothetical protein [Treponema brennaborense]AEE15838.1 hypothetical protein Trebr_0391 [Treponema brennaborense DSM 12168]
MDFNKRSRQLLAGINRQTPAELIQVRIESPESLFDPFDPSPPDNKNINGQLEEYLVEAVKAIKLAVPVKIRVVVSEKSGITDDVRATITRHFHRKAEKTIAANKRRMRAGRINLITGVAFLAVCLAASQFFALPVFREKDLFNTLNQSFGIIGWVALWEPATFLLYGWRESAQDVTAYVRLSLAEIEFAVQGFHEQA